jgi:chromosome segregation protein
MVTHSRRTMEVVDRLFGITMENTGMSKVVSVDIQDMKKMVPDNQTAVQPEAVLH